MTIEYQMIDVVPHGQPMVLLDRVESFGPTSLEASHRVGEQSMFFEPGAGVPTWVGIEYMGQAIAAWAGVNARIQGEPVKIGFLVSSRRYESPVSHFPPGALVRVLVEQVTDNESGLNVFECRLSWDSHEIRANLNVYLPGNVLEYLAETET